MLEKFSRAFEQCPSSWRQIRPRVFFFNQCTCVAHNQIFHQFYVNSRNLNCCSDKLKKNCVSCKYLIKKSKKKSLYFNEILKILEIRVWIKNAWFHNLKRRRKKNDIMYVESIPMQREQANSWNTLQVPCRITKDSRKVKVYEKEKVGFKRKMGRKKNFFSLLTHLLQHTSTHIYIYIIYIYKSIYMQKKVRKKNLKNLVTCIHQLIWPRPMNIL